MMSYADVDKETGEPIMGIHKNQNIIFLVYSKYGEGDIKDKIGVAEYSYYFVLKSFLPVLGQFGHVECLSGRDDVLACYEAYKRQPDRRIIMLSFTPPHSAPKLNGYIPMPVFAWEYDTLPDEDWSGEGEGDWIGALKTAGCAVTHSTYSQKVVKKALGRDYPIFKIPSPVWDGLKAVRWRNFCSISYKRFSLQFTGVLLDSLAIDFSRLDDDFWRQYCENETPFTDADGWGKGDVCQVAMPGTSQTLEVSGVVYTSIFNPFDGRKNWQAMVTAFCYAHRKNRRATLIMKISANHYAAFTDAVVDMLRKLAPIQCRVVVMYGFLNNEEYQKLVAGTSFYVNTSFGEGQCIPLMEFLSAGIPAIAPKVTAMNDYIRRRHSLVVKAHPEPSCWQHDPREKFRCMHYRVDWQSLKRAYKISYFLAMPLGFPLYKLMQFMAVMTLYRHCSLRVCSKELKKLIEYLKRSPVKAQDL